MGHEKGRVLFPLKSTVRRDCCQVEDKYVKEIELKLLKFNKVNKTSFPAKQPRAMYIQRFPSGQLAGDSKQIVMTVHVD